MPVQPVRRLARRLPVPSAAWLTVALAAAACDGGTTPNPDAAQVAYLRDADSRRAALVASLVNPDNAYSSLRLAHYASGDWERLAVWNPRVAPVTVEDLDAWPGAGSLPADARALDLPDEATWEPTVPLESLGEQAFFRYPMQLAPPEPWVVITQDLWDKSTPSVRERYQIVQTFRGWGYNARGKIIDLIVARRNVDVAGKDGLMRQP